MWVINGAGRSEASARSSEISPSTTGRDVSAAQATNLSMVVSPSPLRVAPARRNASVSYGLIRRCR